MVKIVEFNGGVNGGVSGGVQQSRDEKQPGCNMINRQFRRLHDHQKMHKPYPNLKACQIGS